MDLVSFYNDTLVAADEELRKEAAEEMHKLAEEDAAGRIMARGFMAELEKVAKYPISKLLSGRLGYGGLAGGHDAASMALSGAGAGAAASAGAVGAGAGVLGMHIRRILGGRAIMGQIRRGGKGMMAHDKRRLAEASGMTVPQLNKVMKNIEKKIANRDLATKDVATFPISRVLNTKYMPLNIPSRVIGSRGFAGRAAAGGKGMTTREKEILKMLKTERSADKRRKLIMGLGGGGAAAAAAKKTLD